MSKISPTEDEKNSKLLYKKEQRLKLKTKLVELIQSSTSHGLPNIFKAEHISIKLIWIICFMVSVSVCSYMIVLSINQYIEYDVVTKAQIITETKSTFPTISICQVHPLTTKYAEAKVENVLEGIIIDFNITNLTGLDYVGYSLSASTLVLLNAYLNRFNKSYSVEKYGFSVKDTLMYCTYNEINCNYTNFEWYFDVNNGNCFRFNSGLKQPLKETNKAGPQNGLLVYFLLDETKNKFIFSEGLKIFIHNNSVEPNLAEGISIELSKSTLIAIERTQISKEPYPYSDCIDLKSFDSKFYRVILDSNMTYRQSNCLDLCLQEIIISSCSCYDLNYLKLDDSTPCLTMTQFMCASKMYASFRNKNLDEECLRKCPLECDSMSFNTRLSSSTFPTKYLFDALGNVLFQNASFDDVKKRVLELKIYYSKLSYLSLTESPKTSIIDLFSNIGGTLGLYVGVSLLSLVEIVEILVEVLVHTFNLKF